MAVTMKIFLENGRDDLKKAVDKLTKYARKENISGISLSTFGSISYSDFEFDKYTCKSNIRLLIFADRPQAHSNFLVCKQPRAASSISPGFYYICRPADVLPRPYPTGIHADKREHRIPL